MKEELTQNFTLLKNWLDELFNPIQHTPNSNQYYISKSTIKTLTITLGIFTFFGGVIIPSGIVNQIGFSAGRGTIRELLKFALYLGGFAIVLNLYTKNRLIAELKEQELYVAKNIPIGGKFTYLVHLYKIIRNRFTYQKIPYRQITSITKDEMSIYDDVILIHWRNERGVVVSFPTALNLLGEENLERFQTALQRKVL